MYDIGIDKFYYEELAQCNEDELDKLEIYYINKYNSFNNGYNSTTGGKQYKNGKRYTEPEYMCDVLRDYYEGMSWYSIAAKYKKSIGHIQKLIRVENKTRNESAVDKGYKTRVTKKSTNKNLLSQSYINSLRNIIMYDANFNFEGTFNNMDEIQFYILDNEQYMDYNKIYNIRNRIGLALFNNGIAYGHRWQLYSSLILEDKVFLTSIDKEVYRNGGKAIKYKDKNYWVVEGAVDKFLGPKENKNRCKICGIKISSKANMCRECYKKKLREESPISELYNVNTLLQKLNEHNNNYSAIAREYKVTSKAIEKIVKRVIH